MVAALCVAAIGKDRVFGLHMPERDSSEDTLAFSTLVSDSLGIDSVVEDITPVLEAARCYERRDDAIRMVCPDYGPDHKSKIVLPSVVESESLRLYSVVVQAPDGTTTRHRLTTESYLGIVAATNFKQRARRMTEYYHADRLNYVVTGTPNRLEYDQGFFVKLGDGAADVKPIAHLYKTQVYALADFLGVPEQVRTRPVDDRHLLAAAVAGGVLLLPAVEPDGPLPARQEHRPPDRAGRRVHRSHDRPGRARLRRHRPEAQDHRLPPPAAAAGRARAGDRMRNRTTGGAA